MPIDFSGYIHSEDLNCDPIMVEQIANAGLSAMERACIPGITNASEVLSASFTILDRILGSVQRLQEPDERIFNTRQIANLLQEMLVTHGTIPS